MVGASGDMSLLSVSAEDSAASVTVGHTAARARSPVEAEAQVASVHAGQRGTADLRVTPGLGQGLSGAGVERTEGR